MTDKPIKPIANPIDPKAKQPSIKRNPSLKLGTEPDPAENKHIMRSVAERDAAPHDPVDVSSAGTTDSEVQSPTKSGSPRETKKSRAIALLRTETGITISELSTALGWQQHTTRAALSRLGKAGIVIAVRKPADGSASTYRISMPSSRPCLRELPNEAPRNF